MHGEDLLARLSFLQLCIDRNRIGQAVMVMDMVVWIATWTRSIERARRVTSIIRTQARR